VFANDLVECCVRHGKSIVRSDWASPPLGLRIMKIVDPKRTLFNLEKARILLVDGDQMSVNIMSQILLGFGAKNVMKSFDLEDARKQAVTNVVDLVIIDPATFGPNGYDYVPWLRRHASAQNRFVSVLSATGHTQATLVGRSRDAGVNFVVTKPLSPAIVFDRIMWMAREKRPFLECGNYIGPERRFQEIGPPPGEPGRRKDDIADEARFAPERELSQADIDSLMDKTRRAS
jgi:PleD family two-component response regulator